jgi:transcriptional regulator of nitric oxide reductase
MARRRSGWLTRAVAWLLIALPAGSARADEAELLRLLPGATRLVAEPGPPPAWAGLDGDRPVGYVLSTRAAIGSLGYSGKPLDILIGLGLDLRITGAEVREQHEPIAATGATAQDIEAFVRGHVGRSIVEPIRVTRAARGPGEIDAIGGVTVSSLVINDAIMAAARAVARQRGLLGGAAAGVDLEQFEPAGWPELLTDGSLALRRFTRGEVQAELRALGGALPGPGAPDALFIELTTGLASVARIGRNLLGTTGLERVRSGLHPSDLLIFVAGRGQYSFKGTAWRQGGLFDRIQLVQGERAWQFRAEDHVRIDALEIAGAPELREMALFVVRAGTGFGPAEPWRLDLLVEGRDAAGSPVPALLAFPYALPERYLRPVAAAPDVAEPLWLPVWRARLPELAILAMALAILSGIFFFQEGLVKRRRRLRRLRLAFLLFTLLWLGWWERGQLSVVNVLTFMDALRAGFRWDMFLLEPLIFVLWSGTAAALVLWGRGPFCGWLCPFGALQELTNQAGRRLGVPQLTVPWWLHERLRSLKFLIFLVIFAAALGGLAIVPLMVEVEPFKTAIVLRFLREPWFVAWAVALLVVGLFIERFWCRYLCPLGAALAIPARLRQFEWLRRHRQCGVECRICAVRCPVQAIQPDGRIHPGECIHCLDCQVNYHDDRLCPPMIVRRQRRERQAALVAAKPARPPGPS